MTEGLVMHTPGPWRVTSPDEFGAFGDVVDSGGNYLAMAQARPEDHGVTGQPVRQANARLIAAAPDLKDSVKEFIDLRNWVVLAGGADGPLPEDTIRQFGIMQHGIIQRALVALKKAE